MQQMANLGILWNMPGSNGLDMRVGAQLLCSKGIVLQSRSKKTAVQSAQLKRRMQRMWLNVVTMTIIDIMVV